MIEAPTQCRYQEHKERTNDIWGYSQELLLHGCATRVDGLDDGREEERDGEHCNVIKHENAGCSDGDGVSDAALQLCAIDLVKQNGLGQTFRLDAIDSEFLLFFREPAGSFGTVGYSEEGDQ